jgi:hypothetical protein
MIAPFHPVPSLQALALEAALLAGKPVDLEAFHLVLGTFEKLSTFEHSNKRRLEVLDDDSEDDSDDSFDFPTCWCDKCIEDGMEEDLRVMVRELNGNGAFDYGGVARALQRFHRWSHVTMTSTISLEPFPSFEHYQKSYTSQGEKLDTSQENELAYSCCLCDACSRELDDDDAAQTTQDWDY